MTATIISGKQIAQVLRQQLQALVNDLNEKKVQPGLAVVLVGQDPASLSYVSGKKKACQDLGIQSFDYSLPADIAENELLDLVDKLNKDPKVNGILVQLPLPKSIDAQKIIQKIDPSKDVDGFHPISLGKLILGLETFLPCTPAGILKMLEKTGVSLAGAKVVVVGRSNIVGKPIALMLLQAPYHATVTVCHTRTKDLSAETKKADIIIAAAGSPGTITSDMVKPGACVIDVGVNRVEDLTAPKGFRLVGDVDSGVAEVAGFLTPVPGGVGPMTITMLMYNTVKACCMKNLIPFDI